MMSAGLLIVLMLIATVTDLWRHKIYNWTTYAGIGAALLLSGAGSLWGTGLVSYVTFPESIIGFLLCGVIMLVCFVLFQVGGGDVKLLAMVGAFLGPEFGLEALLWTFVLGGMTGLIVLVWKFGCWQLIRRTGHQLLWKMRLGRWVPLSEEERKQLKMPLFLAPNALAAVLIVHFSLLERLV